MQPTFNPWLGYFDLIDYVDEFIFFDTVQLSRQSWQTRNKIKVQDKELMISIPIQKKTPKEEKLLIKDALIESRKFDFRNKLIKTIEQNYNKSYFFNEVNDFVMDLIEFKAKHISNYNINFIEKISRIINIDTKLIRLSETKYNSDTKKAEQVFSVCQYFGVKKYISPLGSKIYLGEAEDKFINNDISISYQYYNHPMYRQIGTEFISHLGILDLLYNEGFKNSLKIIRSGRRYRYEN